jgi:hypothetical protein
VVIQVKYTSLLMMMTEHGNVLATNVVKILQYLVRKFRPNCKRRNINTLSTFYNHPMSFKVVADLSLMIGVNKMEWKFKRPYDGDEIFSSIETEDERIICLLPEPHFMPDCGDTTWYNGNVEALKYNAHLISAAPEMYAALKNLVDRSLIKDLDGDHFYEVLDALRKAEGRE